MKQSKIPTLENLGHCDRTISGNHVPDVKHESYTVTFYCRACGKFDDTGEFYRYIHYKNTGETDVPKYDDTVPKRA